MELTKEQIEFLDRVCDGRWELNSNGEVDVDGDVWANDMNLTEIPVKFGSVAWFYCENNQLTSLKNCPNSINGSILIENNLLCDYFKNINEEDFPHWDKLYWVDVLKEYPFLINIGKNYLNNLEYYLDIIPQTKLYLE